MTKTTQEMTDDAVGNLILSGLTLEQSNSIPTWLLENIEKNKKIISTAIIDARIDERENAKLPFTGDHKNCIDKRTCIGYQGAESDLYNENLIRIAALEIEKRTL